MNALTTHTKALRERGHKALVAYFTFGYPDAATFEALVRVADNAGADVIEIGIPFSDPIADGPVIQAAAHAALARGATLQGALEASARLSRDIRAPLVAMTYVNPVLRMGVDAFCKRAVAAGVRGVILPDVSFEESEPVRNAARAAGLSYVDLVAPTSGNERVARIAEHADGFLYLVSVTGVTGARATLDDTLPAFVESVRKRSPAPVYVGFGIASAEQAGAVARMADGVIIGSRLLSLVAEGPPEGALDRVGGFLAGVRRTLDGT